MVRSPATGLPCTKRDWLSRIPARIATVNVRETTSHRVCLCIRRRAVKFGAVVGDQASENVEGSGRAFGVGLAGNIFRQVQFLDQRDDVDAIFFENRSASEIDARHAEFFDLGLDRAVRAGQKARAHAMRHVAEAQIEACRLDVVRVDRGRGDDISPGNQVADFLRGKDSCGPGLRFVRPAILARFQKRSGFGSK